MSEMSSCRECGAQASPDDTFCGQCGSRIVTFRPSAAAEVAETRIAETEKTETEIATAEIPATPGSPRLPEIVRAWFNAWTFPRVAIRLTAVAVGLVVLAWLEEENSVDDFAYCGLCVLPILAFAGTLTMSFLRPMKTGWAVVLVVVIHAIPVICLNDDMVKHSIAELQPVFLVAGIINAALVAIVNPLRKRRLRRSE